MKAIQLAKFGGPEVLQLSEAPIPAPGPNQVLVRVRTAGMNPRDAKIRRGALEATYPTPLPYIPGLELAGVVEAVGESVTGISLGEEVLGRADTGAYAEFALSSQFIRKPAAMPWDVAGVLLIAGATALRALGELDLKSGETLIIHGAAGGVGSAAVQLAASRGVRVIGTASEANQDHVRALGAVPVVYGEGLAERVRALSPQGVDAAFDVAGRGALPDSIDLAGGPARVITIADPSAAALGVRFSGGAPAPHVPAELVRLWEDGVLRPTIGGAFALEQAAEAHRIIDTGHGRGKLLIVVD